MREPCFKRLKQDIERGEKGSWSYASRMHPNPYFWKYSWWVFHEGSPCDGWQFLQPEHRLPTGIALPLARDIRERGGLCLVYNRRLPRLDPVRSPFDPAHPRWIDYEWAPAFEDDTDPLYQDFK